MAKTGQILWHFACCGINMKLKKISAKYKKGVRTIAESYHHLLNDFDADDNHDFRVGVKKLRAFIRLTNRNKIPKPIKKFYRLVGELRNIQLHEQRVQSFSDDLEPYLETLHQEERSLRKKAMHSAPLSLKRFQKKLVHNAPAKLTQEEKTGFLKQNISRLAQLLALPYYSDEDLHEIRKVLKDIMYNFDYLKDAMLPAPLNNLQFMKELTDKLGDFHDLVLALSFVEGTGYVRLQTHLQLSKDNLKNDLLSLLRAVNL